MSQVTNRNSGDQPIDRPTKKRSGGERAIVWIGIAGLACLVAFEWASRHHFDATMKRLEAAIIALEKQGERNGIPSTQLNNHISGFVFRNIVTTDVLAVGDNGVPILEPQPRLICSWPSLFRTYKLGLSLNHLKQVIYVEALIGDAET